MLMADTAVLSLSKPISLTTLPLSVWPIRNHDPEASTGNCTLKSLL
jgi:hypothetical protein